ncbi:MAG: hypothetical protein ICV77_13790 [Cyanobacteria bacterium Co-bin8]|nr:hypothetical protein [Cyanobacteria bacterium Co-bin8]
MPDSVINLANRWQMPPSSTDDPIVRGTRYLEELRQITPASVGIDLGGELCDRMKMCGWIGLQIQRVNQHLQSLLEECEACLHPADRPFVQILAAPLANNLGLDGVCILQTRPITLLIDVGRVLPQDWLAMVAHEYAHAVVGSPGHDVGFQQTLTHLCLGLGLLSPPTGRSSESLASWPPCQPQLHPTAFWLGKTPLPHR